MAAKLAITREQALFWIEIQETVNLEAYKNSYLHFIDPSAAVAVYTDTHTNTLPYTSLADAHRGIITSGGYIQMLAINSLETHLEHN